MNKRQVLGSLGNFIGIEQLGANQNIIHFENGSLFQSYESLICVKIGSELYFTDDWNYSRTTSKYRNKFTGESTQETRAKLESDQHLKI